MKMEVIEEFNNELLKRKEIIVSSAYESNPGFERVCKDVAGKFKADEALVVVRRIGSSFGSGEFVIDAFVYESVEAKNNVEPKKKEKKGGSK